jgi:hypothetical protein
MTKQELIDNQNSCWNKAEPDEPLFVLMARDIASEDAILEWIQKRIDYKKNVKGDSKLTDAMMVMNAMENWRYQREF